MPNFFDAFSTATVNSYVRNRTYQTTRMDQLFPPVKTMDTKVTTAVGAFGLPVTASVHAFDSTTEIASREAVDIITLDKVLIKRQIPMREEMILQYNNTNNRIMQTAVMKQAFNDADRMVESVLTRARALAMEVLSTGKITIKNENHIKNITLDYGMPESHFEALTSGALWSAEGTANPLDDLQRWSDKIVEDGGERPAYALMSRKVLATIAKSAAIKKSVLGTEVSRPLSISELNTFMQSLQLPQLVSFDEKYRAEVGGKYETRAFINPNKVILIPNGAVGRSEFGPTAEEYELAQDPSIDLISKQNVIVEVYRTPDPVAHYTKAVATNIPSFERANEVFVATVLEG